MAAKIKVKVITGDKPAVIETEINDFLESIQYKYRDIKYNVVPYNSYTAWVEYDIDEP